jgi:hypothetical protein
VEEYEEQIPLDESCEQDWIRYLTEFEERVWPMFKRRGYTKDAALITWKIHQVLINVGDLANPPNSDPF